MKALSIREMRSQLGSLDRLVALEHEIIITRRGKPIARLLPIQGQKRKPSHEALRAALPRLKEPSEILQRDEREGR